MPRLVYKPSYVKYTVGIKKVNNCNCNYAIITNYCTL